MKVSFFLPILLMLGGWAWGQQPSDSEPRRKPVLIRADTNEETPEVFEHNPLKAKKYVEIGDFYLKRDNYKAAEERYRDAIKHHTRWVIAYEKLIKVLRRQEAFLEAAAVCEEFITANPSSQKVDEFRRLAESLQELEPGR